MTAILGRHGFKPGIKGLGQVNGAGETRLPERCAHAVQYDLFPSTTGRFAVDLKIIRMMTVHGLSIGTL